MSSQIWIFYLIFLCQSTIFIFIAVKILFFCEKNKIVLTKYIYIGIIIR